MADALADDPRVRTLLAAYAAAAVYDRDAQDQADPGSLVPLANALADRLVELGAAADAYAWQWLAAHDKAPIYYPPTGPSGDFWGANGRWMVEPLNRQPGWRWQLPAAVVQHIGGWYVAETDEAHVAGLPREPELSLTLAALVAGLAGALATLRTAVGLDPFHPDLR